MRPTRHDPIQLDSTWLDPAKPVHVGAAEIWVTRYWAGNTRGTTRDGTRQERGPYFVVWLTVKNLSTTQLLDWHEFPDFNNIFHPAKVSDEHGNDCPLERFFDGSEPDNRVGGSRLKPGEVATT